ncbi:MAG: glycine zipper domain-containing protein [Pseudomonadota bacterium]
MTFTKSTLILAAFALTVAGCTDPARFDPNAPDRNQTQAGAILGGVVGAIAGINASSREDRTKGAIVGAVIGAAAGGAIGQRLDQQEADLRRDLGNQQVRIENTGSELIVTMPQDILFAVDSATVRADLRRDLGALAGNLQAYPNTTVQIIGIRITLAPPRITKVCPNAAHVIRHL